MLTNHRNRQVNYLHVGKQQPSTWKLHNLYTHYPKTIHFTIKIPNAFIHHNCKSSSLLRSQSPDRSTFSFGFSSSIETLVYTLSEHPFRFSSKQASFVRFSAANQNRGFVFAFESRAFNGRPIQLPIDL